MEYETWVKKEENGLLKKKEVGDYVFECMYKPADFILASEWNKGRLNQNGINERREGLKGMMQFDLRIKTRAKGGNVANHGLNSMKEVDQRLYYLSFGLQNDLFLLAGDKKTPCKLFHYDRSSDLGTSKLFLVGFPSEFSEGKDFTILIDSREFGTGPVKIKFERSLIETIPNLNI